MVFLKRKVIHRCTKCGYESIGMLGKCPECGSWGTLLETLIEDKKSKSGPSIKRNIKRLKEIESTNSDRVSLNMKEFNRVMGGGVVRDSVTILSAKPGSGKSTLLLQVANEFCKQGYKVLYASGEESESQIRTRADRIINDIHNNLWVISDNSMDNVLDYIREIDPDLIIVDSIQTFILDEFSTSRAGSPTQTMECAHKLVTVAKNVERPRMVFVVGQMTKEDELAGLRALEHLVDTVLIIEGESGDELRTLLTTKNRYGSTGEMGFFNMTDKGMVSLDNPSEYFMSTNRGSNVTGSCITVVREGTRPIVLEVESLISQSFMPYPSRIAECMRRDQLNTLISILEQRGGVNLFDKNVVIKTTGGMKLKEQASNLAVIMSIVSSALNIPIPNDIAFIADVGLTGELKKVPSLEARIKEVDRMGFSQAVIAPSKNLKTENLELVQLKDLRQVINLIK